MAKSFDYQGAIKEGYSPEEIGEFLKESNPKFDYQGAIEAGYSPEEVSEFLSTPKKRSKGEKIGRIATQVGVGALENALLPYEIASIPLQSEDAQAVALRQNIFEDIERLGEKKRIGQDFSGRWDDKDEELLQSLVSQIQNPEELQKNVQTMDIGVRGLLEKATGEDLHPEGALEKGASWWGFLKNPKKALEAAKNISKSGTKVKDVLKVISPGKDALSSLGAGTALEIAEDGQFGPLGTMASAIVGHSLGHGVAGAAKSLASPKKTIANSLAKLTPSNKLELQKEIIKEFREAGLQPDIGTITGSDLIKFMQSRMSQSGLIGKELEAFKQSLSNDIKKQYGEIADSLGELKYKTLNEAGEAGKEGITSIRDAEKQRISKMYDRARASVKPNVEVAVENVQKSISRIEKALKPGSLKSPEQKKVIDTLSHIKSDINKGKASVEDLMNIKVALGDLIDFEVQGGQKQLLKNVSAEIEKSIQSYGEQNPIFKKNYTNAQKDFSKHAKTFRDNQIDKILKNKDPMTIMNKLNTVQGIREVGKALESTPEGKELFKNLKRMKVQQLIGDKMTHGVSEQLKTGTFSNLLKNPKDKQLVLEMLGKEGFSRLSRLQKASGRLAETAQKFFNASQSGTAVVDMALISKVLTDLGYVFAGNPWPLLKTGGVYSAASYMSKLISDPNFLKLVEESILSSSKNDIPAMIRIAKEMEQPIKAAISLNSEEK